MDDGMIGVMSRSHDVTYVTLVTQQVAVLMASTSASLATQKIKININVYLEQRLW
jgi:hypothetical protein